MDSCAHLEASGLSDVIAHVHDEYKWWTAVDAATSKDVDVYWHAHGDAAGLRELLVCANASVSRLSRAIPASVGTFYAFEASPGLNVADIMAAAAGRLPLKTATAIALGLSRVVCACHANRIIVGTLCLR